MSLTPACPREVTKEKGTPDVASLRAISSAACRNERGPKAGSSALLRAQAGARSPGKRSAPGVRRSDEAEPRVRCAYPGYFGLGALRALPLIFPLQRCWGRLLLGDAPLW